MLFDRDGRTAEQFLTELFEFEYCAECGGDAPDHTPVPFMGNWFARCGPDAVDRRTD